MSDAPVRIFAFDPCVARDASTALAGAGVTLRSRRIEAMWNVRGDPADENLMSEAARVLGVALPRQPNTSASAERVRALWLGPDEWLIVSDASIAPTRTPGVTLTFTDVSHGRAAVRLSGPRVRDALAKGCALDLDPRYFAVGACAQTAIARINIVLDHVAADVFDLYCPRSYAGSLWHWLNEAAAEYACNVLPAA